MKGRTELTRTLLPAVYKVESTQSDTTHQELTQGKTEDSEEPTS
jgi:hypothetical protein